ncbi:hypothetical protein ANO11243_042280 [Dothideomycetidae sp. 11243]|nr:hypothetical protein ANO11243_042280 [fungal sp. No.11243]
MPQKIEVVIVGASYAGTGVAHGILKDIPQAHVTMIDPSEFVYFNIAAPRILAKPAEIKLDKILLPTAKLFEKYPSSRFQFVRGLVTSVDPVAKVVHVGDLGPSMSYDILVVCSGSTTPGTLGKEAIPFKATGSNNMKEAIEAAQARIKKADSIVIVGAGPVGVETAGEIAQAYPRKTVTLISSHEQVLPALKRSAGKAAETDLRKLGVKVITSARVTNVDKESSGTHSVRLDTRKVLQAQLVISAAGNVANSSFMPRDSLDADGWIKVDENLRITAIRERNAFALGDATTFKQRYMLKVQDQIPVVVNNIKQAIEGHGKLRAYNQSDKLMVFVPIGSSSGTGQVGGWVPFSFLVAFAKGKDYFASKAGSFFGAK